YRCPNSRRDHSYRWRDPSGRDAEGWFLRNADTLQNGALAVSGAALTLATGGLAGELLGFGTLEGTLGASGAALTGAARAAASGAGAAATAGLAAARSCGDKAESALRFGANDLVYGPSAGGALRQLQQAAGGRLLTDVGGPAAGQSWAEFSIQTLENQLASGGNIRFDLSNVNDIQGVLNGTAYVGATTSAELNYLQANWSNFQNQVSFYSNGAEVSAPW
ncbi:MAG: hypothetical protein ABJB12_11970, partial [Pseudomonadota bacterium]